MKCIIELRRMLIECYITLDSWKMVVLQLNPACTVIGLTLVSWGSGITIGGRPSPDVTILGWHHIMTWNHNSTDLWWIPYFFHFVWSSPSSFGLKTHWFLDKTPPFFSFGLRILLDRKPTYFAAQTFSFGLHLVTFCQKNAYQSGRPARLHNLSRYSPGRLINPYVRFHFYLWLRWSWRYVIPLPLRWRRLIHASNQRKRERPPLSPA